MLMPPSAAVRLSVADMEAILTVTRALSAPFDLHDMLSTVTAAARRVLHAERASVWLLDAPAGMLWLEVSSDLPRIQLPLGAGLVGACARDRCTVNVPDCYADPRFNPAVDRESGFRTRCSLTLPLVDHQDNLIGVMQVLNRAGGAFDSADEALAEALAAQCAVALARVRLTESLIAAELMRQEVELVSQLQRSTLPKQMPVLPGYDMHGVFQPAALTGGDTYDLALLDQRLLIVLGDATGHGIGPALSVTRMHAMLRMALRLGADLETAFRQVNDQLSEVLPDGHFVTAFVGLLDPVTHGLRFLSGGQGPILHLQAADGACTAYRATSFPLGAMPIQVLRPAVDLTLAPGDWLLLLSDGVYEYEDPDGLQFGRDRVARVACDCRHGTAAAMAQALLSSLHGFARGAPQQDDITLVLLHRRPDAGSDALVVTKPSHDIATMVG